MNMKATVADDEPLPVLVRAEENLFELPISKGYSAKIQYHREGKHLVLLHTDVPYIFSGQGIGTELATAVFEEARASSFKIILRCAFLRDFYARNPQYSDIVAG